MMAPAATSNKTETSNFKFNIRNDVKKYCPLKKCHYYSKQISYFNSNFVTRGNNLRFFLDFLKKQDHLIFFQAGKILFISGFCSCFKRLSSKPPSPWAFGP